MMSLANSHCLSPVSTSVTSPIRCFISLTRPAEKKPASFFNFPAFFSTSASASTATLKGCMSAGFAQVGRGRFDPLGLVRAPSCCSDSNCRTAFSTCPRFEVNFKCENTYSATISAYTSRHIFCSLMAAECITHCSFCSANRRTASSGLSIALTRVMSMYTRGTSSRAPTLVITTSMQLKRSNSTITTSKVTFSHQNVCAPLKRILPSGGGGWRDDIPRPALGP
mmetsp:Transcript_28509/g.63196  ORF Transcript_28509/g.63196 Transcript_28509/m.63196 type:complete len:224 (+) Transcript_28509:1705-2376(+)